MHKVVNISKLAHRIITSSIANNVCSPFSSTLNGFSIVLARVRLPVRHSLVHQTVSPHEREGSGNETKPVPHCDAFLHFSGFVYMGVHILHV